MSISSSISGETMRTVDVIASVAVGISALLGFATVACLVMADSKGYDSLFDKIGTRCFIAFVVVAVASAVLGLVNAIILAPQEVDSTIYPEYQWIGILFLWLIGTLVGGLWPCITYLVGGAVCLILVGFWMLSRFLFRKITGQTPTSQNV